MAQKTPLELTIDLAINALVATFTPYWMSAGAYYQKSLSTKQAEEAVVDVLVDVLWQAFDWANTPQAVVQKLREEAVARKLLVKGPPYQLAQPRFTTEQLVDLKVKS